ncbi:rod shape-determining protein MreD [Lampropedia puyangensis]|uniref:Rod shape-determining protein MreD n=1 Tax=Lampropedia puyangensis TaxID=1330072 RepID=A0A4S8EX22_9BURK|nr:rod shape-determining protein MreD [Lampropedia puyangensis]THT99362.1 rod shape-determining protein MreD [Lampropedia puyangensis]
MVTIRHTEQILRPAKTSFMVMSLVLALCIELVPLGPLPWRPDVLLVVIAFWALYQPQRMGITVAFLLGLAMDVHAASLLGQHALAYIVAVYWIQGARNRLLWYPSSIQQAILLLVPFAIAAALQALTGWLSSHVLPQVTTVFALILQAVLWPFVRRLLLAPQLSALTEKERRPL